MTHHRHARDYPAQHRRVVAAAINERGARNVAQTLGVSTARVQMRTRGTAVVI